MSQAQKTSIEGDAETAAAAATAVASAVAAAVVASVVVVVVAVVLVAVVAVSVAVVAEHPSAAEVAVLASQREWCFGEPAFPVPSSVAVPGDLPRADAVAIETTHNDVLFTIHIAQTLTENSKKNCRHGIPLVGRSPLTRVVRFRPSQKQ